MSHPPSHFREVLAWLLDALDQAMPPALWEEAWDHCYRHDGQGLTLCFGGPLREELLTRLLPWLDAEAPDVASRLRATLAPTPEPWPGPYHRGEVELVRQHPVGRTQPPAPQPSRSQRSPQEPLL